MSRFDTDSNEMIQASENEFVVYICAVIGNTQYLLTHIF